MWIDGEWSNDKTGYDRMLDLHRMGWGWEFMRREPGLIRTARRARLRHPVVAHRRDGKSIIRLRRRCPQAEEYGLQFFPDPSLSAFETVPFWLPDALSDSLSANLALTHERRAKDAGLSLEDLPGERHYLIGPGRRPKLIIAAKGYAAQLALDENAIAVPQAVYLSLRLGAGELVGNNLNLPAVEEFAAFCSGHDMDCKPLRGLSPEKLRDTIIALDGELAGVSRRRIAEVIFGKNIIASAWNDGSQCYQKRTKRLVEKGEELMAYGYRNLL
ncbi:MAG: DUF2285 domain-containing protein [Pseudomonadota bacterium]